MKITLKPVQHYALKECNYRRRFGFFLEQGLGKTLLSLVEFMELFERGQVQVMNLFCPNTLIFNWKDQIEDHGFKIATITKPTDLHELFEYTAKQLPVMVLYNYESIITDGVGKTIPLLTSQFKTYNAFDESVQIKNFQSQRWKKIRNWEDKLTYVRLLSGRPYVHSPMDMWTQLTLLGAKVHYSPYAYRNHFCVMGGWKNKVIVGVQNQDQLMALIKSVSVTATKKEWAPEIPEKLPPKIVDYKLSPIQSKYYKQMFDNMMVEFSEDKNITVTMAAHKWTKLQQLSSGFMLDEGREPQWFEDFKDTPKLKALEDLLETIGSKCLVFAFFRETVQALAKHFDAPYIIGGMDEDEIKAAKDTFNKSKNTKPFILQSTSSKYGLTLLGNDEYPCHNNIYFENNYALDDRIQTEDRAHRWGQKYSVGFWDFSSNPAERRVIRALQKKDNVSKLILGIIKSQLEGAVI